MARDLGGRAALVTGAGSGIGRALALALAAQGAEVVVAGRRRSALEETRSLSSRPSRLLVAPADVTDAGDRARLASLVREAHGRLDLLINNAGLVASGPAAEMGDARMHALVALNVIAPLAVTRDCLPLLRRGDGPRVVMVGSVFGEIAFPLFAAYSASKFAVRGLSDALRRELKPLGIAVTYAAPRATRTPAADGFADLIGPLAMTLDEPDAVAERILRAVRRGARSVYPRGPERLYVLLQRLAPALIDAALARQTARLVGAGRGSGEPSAPPGR